MPSLRIHWNQVQGGAWADFFAVNLDDPHFNELEGVYVAWQGGAQPAVIAVGQGPVREGLKELRAAPALSLYRNSSLFATWAKIEKVARPGVLRYLIEALKPKVAPAAPSTPTIEVNLPGRGDAAPPDVGAPPPGQIYADLLAPESGALKEDAALAVAKKAAAAAEAARQAEAAIAARTEAVAKADAAAKTEIAAATRAETAARSAVVANLQLQPAFNKLIAAAKEVPKSGFFGGGPAKPPPSAEKLIGDVVQTILLEALRMRASDIHLEPQETYLRVRYRIDGILEEVLQVPNDLNLRVVSNVRVQCSLDPEKLSGGKPEDGRVSVKLDGREADLRLSTFPTPYGDKAVLRVIPRATKTVTLDDLGLEPRSAELFRSVLARPQGLIIVTGPTGSGKSNTMYAALHALNDATRNIVTLEDPIERKLAGVTQGMIQPKQGFGFAEGLRAILRQDPNVIMVGEIRDTETADIALSASMTGHLLLTTLHTVSALGAVGRLIDMGLEPFLVASALTAVTAQRLARAVCTGCVEEHTPTAEQLAEVEVRAKKAGISPPSSLARSLKKGAGCPACRGTGYQGRLLIFEAVVVAPPLREVILAKGDIDQLRAAAAKGGMEPLLLDGLRKAAAGRTTLDEVLRVVDAAE
ncbi:MAG: type II/IV secretion system protein [Elusimicrobia bacterium]|nr:type II/IV secretion system protein [Elusimicrobiota bacterium]